MKSLVRNIKIKDFYNQFAQLEKTISKLNNANTFFDDLRKSCNLNRQENVTFILENKSGLKLIIKF